jgi:Flp pilus assembly protein CpaB
MKGLIIAFIPAFVMSLAATAIVLFFLGGSSEDDPKLGWQRVGVLTAQRSFVGGEAVTEQGFAETALPQRFVTDSCVRPADAALIKGRPVTAVVRAGEVLTWAAFTQRPSRKPVDACKKAIATEAEAAAGEARDRAVEAFAEHAALDAGGSPGVLPGPPAGDGDVEILAPNGILQAGEVLHADALHTVKIPRAFFVASMVRADELHAVEGARMLAPSAAGEPLEWQYLDDPAHASTLGGCMHTATQSLSLARQKSAAERATAWFEEHEP